MKEFEICRQRTPEEHRAVQHAEVQRYLADTEKQTREIAGQFMAHGVAYFTVEPKEAEK